MSTTTASDESRSVRLGDLRENDYNPRQRFDPADLDSLADSIEANGLATPLTVRPMGDEFEVVAGMRRLKALRGLYDDDYEIPVLVRELDETEARLVALVENLEREDLTPLEEARAFGQFIGIELGGRRVAVPDYVSKAVEINLSLNELSIPSKAHPDVKRLADDLGISTSQVRARVELLYLPDEMQNWVENGKEKQPPYMTKRAARLVVRLFRGGDWGFANYDATREMGFTDARDVVRDVATDWVVTDADPPDGADAWQFNGPNEKPGLSDGDYADIESSVRQALADHGVPHAEQDGVSTIEANDPDDWSDPGEYGASAPDTPTTPGPADTGADDTPDTTHRENTTTRDTPDTTATTSDPTTGTTTGPAATADSGADTETRTVDTDTASDAGETTAYSPHVAFTLDHPECPDDVAAEAEKRGVDVDTFVRQALRYYKQAGYPPETDW